MRAAPTTAPQPQTEPVGSSIGGLSAWLVAMGFLALGIGGGLIAWLRHGEGAGIEQIISALAIAAVGILAAIVHGGALLVLKRAQRTEREIECEHSATRNALERAAAVPSLAELARSGDEENLGAPASKRRQDELLSWQIDQVAGNIEADAALIRDLKRTHGQAKVAEAWRRSCSPSRSRAIAELADLVSSRRR